MRTESPSLISLITWFLEILYESFQNFTVNYVFKSAARSVTSYGPEYFIAQFSPSKLYCIAWGNPEYIRYHIQLQNDEHLCMLVNYIPGMVKSKI